MGGILGAGASLLGASGARTASGRAASQAMFTPTAINDPFGSVSGQVTGWSKHNPGILNYNQTPGLYGPFLGALGGAGLGSLAQFGDLSQGYGGVQGVTPFLGEQYAKAYGSFGMPSDFFTPGAKEGFAGLGMQNLGLAGGAGEDFASRLFGSGFGGGAQPPQFNLDQATADEFARLNAIAKPGETTQTQSALDRLQSLGRLGLTQNGELGDLGGLQLAQQMAANSRLGQARDSAFGQQNFLQQAFAQNTQLEDLLRNSALSRYGNLGGLAQGLEQFGYGRDLGQNQLFTQNALGQFDLSKQLFGLGSGNLQQSLGLGLSALGGLGGIDEALRAKLNQSIAASQARSGAAANAGALAVSGANTFANALGSLGSGLISGAGGMFGGLGSLGSLFKTTQPVSTSGGFYRGI